MSGDPENPHAISHPVEAEVFIEHAIEQADIDYKMMLEKYRERSVMMDGIRVDALSKTKPHHWLARKDKSGNVTLSLMAPGAERVKLNCPIGFLNITRREEKWTTDEGPGYTIYREALVYVGSPKLGTLAIMSSCRSDADFFSTEHVEMPFLEDNPEHRAAIENGEGKLSFDKKTLYIRRRIPMNEVHKDLIEKTALTQLTVAGVTRALGLRQISPDELSAVGVNIEKIPSIDYGSTRGASGRLAPAVEQQRDEIWKWLMEMHGSAEKASAALKGLTAFNDYQGQADHSRLTEKQIPRLHPKVKAEYDKFREGAPQPAAGKKAQQPPPQGQKPISPEEAARIHQREQDEANKGKKGQSELL